MTVTTASLDGVQFIGGHEGLVLKAYRCPADVVTIGYGFTMRSRTFAKWWRAEYGRDLRMGDRLTKADADMLLRRLLDEEYGAAVADKVRPKKQHHFDGAASVTYNCGPGSLSWRWARALAGGDVREASRLLKTTAVTANGRRLAGLVRRRKDEATLIRTGHYGDHASAAPPAQSRSRAAVKEYQEQLKSLGYYKGEVDGLAGPLTREAVDLFQQEHDLIVDGIVGPATRAALIRDLDARNTKIGTGGAGAGAGAVGGGADVATAPEPGLAVDAALSALGWGIAVAALVLAAFLFLRFRGRITGKRVPT